MMIKQQSIPVVSMAGFVAMWEFAVYTLHIESWILPAPSAVVLSLWQYRFLLARHAVITTGEAVFGLIVGLCVAVVFATCMYFSPVVKKSLYPLLIISQTIPFIALAPLIIVWFGIGMISKMVIIALVCFFPILVNLMDGFTHVNRSILKNLQIVGATHWQIFRLGVVPSSITYFFSGLRIAGSYAILTAVIAEWIGSSAGLGVFLIRAARSYAIDRVFATIIVISAVSLLVVYVIDKLYTFATPWRQSSQHL